MINRLYIIVAIILIYNNKQFHINAFTTTIAGGYLLHPETCVFLEPSPNTTFPLITTHWGEVSGDGNPSDSVIIQIRPTYRFDGSTFGGGFTQGPIFNPEKVTIPWSYCGSDGESYSPITLQPDWPIPTTAGCEGLLLYGYEDIPIIPIDNTIGFNSSIVGKRVRRIDVGYPSQYKGTITYLRPNPGCPTPNVLNFRVLLNITGLNNINDVTPIAYQDSVSLITKYCPVYGLACDLVPRPVNSLRYNPRITITPMCKQVMPFSTAFNLAAYQLMMGGPIKGPSDTGLNPVPLNSIVYEIKVDNLPEPLSIQIKLLFNYVNGTSPSDTIKGPYYVDQQSVYYVASMGTNPAIVQAQYYNDNEPFVEIWNEATLSYLDRCYCSSDNSTVPNLICDSATEPNMISPIARNILPNFNAMPDVYVDAPTCAFYINNGSQVFTGVTFGVESYVVTDQIGATVIYLWEVGGTPIESVDISTPTLPNTNMVINTVGIITVNLTVYLQDFVPPRIRRCAQNLQVFNGAPTASLVPQSATIPLVTFQQLDGSGSTSPPTFGSPVWSWSIVFGPPAGGSLTTTTGPITDFSATIVGVYIVTMQVCNDVACATLSATIIAGSTPSPLVPPVDCFNQSTPPFNFTAPTVPTPSPIAPTPSTPVIPAPIGHGGIFGPVAAIPASAITALTFIAVLIAVLLVFIGIALIIRRAFPNKDINKERQQRKEL